MSKLLTIPRMTVLMILFSFLSVAAVVFTPAYPQLVSEFHLSDASPQWMMTLFLIGTAIGRLPYGPLANRIGRKSTLVLGLIISLFGTLIILASPTYSLICLGRLVQALGCAVTLKIGYTMVGDLYEGPAATKMLSYAMFAYAILPGIGTTISGYLVNSYGWRGGFWFFLFFNIAVILSCFCLPETIKKKDLEALQIKKIASGYAKQLKDPFLVLWSTLMGLSTAVLFIFSQEAPFVAIDLMGLTPAQYGLFYLAPAFGIAGGALFTAYLSTRMRSMKAMMLGILMILAASIAMGLFFLGNWKSGWALFLPQIIIQLGDAVLYTFASSKALTEAEDKSNASAMMLFINSCGSVVGTFLVGILAPKSMMTLPIVFILITLIMVAIWLKLKAHCKANP